MADVPVVQGTEDLAERPPRVIRRRMRDLIAYEILGLELEPGPIYALRDWDTIRGLAAVLRNDPRLRDLAGLNLDIAHWRMALGDEGVSLIRNDPAVFNQIVHAHVSGHHPKAHLGDIHLRVLNKPEHFLPWLNLLSDIADEKRSDGHPPNTGRVSIEYEAAPDRRIVRKSVRQLQLMLTGL